MLDPRIKPIVVSLRALGVKLALDDFGTLGMHVLTEGTEGRHQLNQLRELGCPLGQGFLFARPLPLADAELLVGALGDIPAPWREQAA